MNSVTTIENALLTRVDQWPEPVHSRRRRFGESPRRHLTIPDDHVIVCGVAVGYADDGHRLSADRTTRESVATFATFYDSDATRRAA